MNQGEIDAAKKIKEIVENKPTKKLYNQIALEQLRELEYAIRNDGLVYTKEEAEEIKQLCGDIANLLEEDFFGIYNR